ncbi:MAG: hypothetical protein KDJ88_12025 [Bauldia sp.]|nr:hypothetical protein [Bauldia sp.]
MVKVIAKEKLKPNSFTKLGDVLSGDVDKVSDTSSSGFTAKSGKVEADVGGSGFVFVAKVPVAGTIETIDIFFKGDLAFKVSDLHLTVAQALSLGQMSFEDGLAQFFSGDDLFKGSKENDYLRGFDGNDTLKGRAGNDKLQGDKGEDILNGGKGKDQYFFKDGPGNGMDTITKLQSGEKMKFDHNAFAGIGAKGMLNADLLVIDGPFTNTSQRFSYDTSTKILSYDADGSGSGVAQAVAHIASGNFDADHMFVI